jgi:hypothetical protein
MSQWRYNIRLRQALSVRPFHITVFELSYQERGHERLHQNHDGAGNEESGLPDIGWTAATVRLGIADATPTAAAD